tara:strand:+ start:46457 stop:47146 length:690 start_codon:yes stop_codon:yes gene_type:complete
MKTIRIIIILLLCNISLYAQHQNLDKQQKSIASISALTAKSDWVGLKTELSKGLDNGLTINQIKEELVHLYAYVGFPKSIMGLRTFLTVLDERKANDIKDNWGKEASPIDDTNPKYVRGKKVLEELTKNPLSETKPDYQQFSPEIDSFLKEHLFADIFERDVLSFQQRELITVSALIALGNVEPMLKGHLGICIKQGFTKEQLIQVVETLKPYLNNYKLKSANDIIEGL